MQKINAQIKIDKRSIGKKGSPIKIYITGSGKKKWIPTKLYTEPKHWNGRLMRSHPDFKALNQKLIKREVQLNEELNYCEENNLSFEDSCNIIKSGIKDVGNEVALLKKRLRELEGDSGTMLFEFWETFIEDRRKRGKDLKATIETKKQLENYLLGEDMLINDITYEFLYDFITFKYSNGCKKGGISFYLRTLKTVYLDAQKRESLKIKSINPFLGLIDSTPSKEIVEMTKEELTSFMSYQPKKSSTKSGKFNVLRKKAVFQFQFYIGGHDFVDISLLTWKNIKGNRVRFKRYRNREHPNGGMMVDNVIIPEALEIIKKYGTKESDRVFSFIPNIKDNPKTYKNYRGNTNRALRKISVDLELDHVLKTKSPRYVFNTWAQELKCNFLSIKTAQGQSVDDVAMKYNPGLSKELADEVILNVAKHLFKHEEL